MFYKIFIMFFLFLFFFFFLQNMHSLLSAGRWKSQLMPNIAQRKNKITRDYPNARQRSIRPGWLKRIKMHEACPWISTKYLTAKRLHRLLRVNDLWRDQCALLFHIYFFFFFYQHTHQNRKQFMEPLSFRLFSNT